MKEWIETDFKANFSHKDLRKTVSCTILLNQRIQHKAKRITFQLQRHVQKDLKQLT